MWTRRSGWRVGKDRVERIWRREGLKVPQKQKPRGCLWLNDGSCVRLRPERRNHVWRCLVSSEIFLTSKEAAQLAKLHPVTLLRWARQGKVPHRRLSARTIATLTVNDLADHYKERELGENCEKATKGTNGIQRSVEDILEPLRRTIR